MGSYELVYFYDCCFIGLWGMCRYIVESTSVLFAKIQSPQNVSRALPKLTHVA